MDIGLILGYYFFYSLMKIHYRYKFDDDRVIRVTEKEVMEDNFGGDYPSSKPGFKSLKRFTNAYMLVYVRDSDAEVILSDMTDDDIPEHLRMLSLQNVIFTYRRLFRSSLWRRKISVRKKEERAGGTASLS